MSWKKKAYKLLQILYNYSTPKFAYSGPKISSSSRFQYKFSIVLQICSRKKGKFPVCNPACALLKEKGWNNKSTALNQCKNNYKQNYQNFSFNIWNIIKYRFSKGNFHEQNETK